MFKKKFFFILISLVFILGIPNTHVVFASATDGTIDSINKYAWGENIGWLNFSSSSGNIHVTDGGLTGYAWSENYGWINLHANNLSGGSVTNNGEGVLGGNAWGESLGWIDFSGVSIGANGVFSGYATIASDSSQISFNCSNTSSCGASDFKVSTDWRPASTRPTGGGGGGGGGYIPSCTDRIKNGTETGIDCGGSCPLSCVIPIPPVLPPVIPVPVEQILGSGVCPANLIITDNMRRGDRNGKYSAYNGKTITQVSLLQSHINRILAAQYNQAAGPIDGIFGPLTEQGVKRLQTALNAIVKPVPILVIDGIVGPYTKAAINNSCGGVSVTPVIPTTPPQVLPTPTEQILGSGVCPANLIITDNMKKGVRNGLYSDYNKGIVKQVNILQAHINRILAAQYKQAAGPVDGIFGPLTEQGVKRLQTALNAIVKPKPVLVIDGIVGPFTKAAINNSCGNLVPHTSSAALPLSNQVPVLLGANVFGAGFFLTNLFRWFLFLTIILALVSLAKYIFWKKRN